MTDELERQLRSSLRRVELPLAPDRLRDVLAGLPALEQPMPQTRSLVPGGLLRLAAALAVVAVGLGTLAAGYYSWLPGVGPTPSASPAAQPSPSVTAQPSPQPTSTATPDLASLPEPAGLLAQYPAATLEFERSVGPANAPRSGDATVQRTELDERPVLAGQFVIAGACLGEGQLAVEVRLLNQPGSAGEPWPGLLANCDGKVASFEHATPADDRSLDIQLVAVTAPRGASWRLAVGQLPAPAGAPEFDPVTPTEGWWPLWGATVLPQPATPPNGTGLGVRVPDDVTFLAVVVQCVPVGEEVQLTFVVERSGASAPQHENVEQPIGCTAGAGERIEFPVSAGEEIAVRAVPQPSAWIQLYMEGDAQPTSVYGEPPADLPADLAEVPYLEAGGLYVGYGTLGSERQRLIHAPGAPPDLVPAGDLVALNRNTPTETTLELFSLAEGRRLHRLADEPPTQWIRATWIDAEREQVFYLLSGRFDGGTTLKRVALDGGGRQTLSNVPAGDTGLISAELALDGSLFVLDSCAAPDHCHRQLIDADTLEVTGIDLDLEGEYCAMRGVTDGLVVIETGFSCSASGTDATVIQATDGTQVARLDGVRRGVVLRTSEGPALIHQPSEQDPAHELVDLRSAVRRPVDPGAELMRAAERVRLPADWVLFHQSGLGDFPRHPFMRLGMPPRLVNVLTGEFIELPNLPHER